ncbi:MAG: MotA/TolQ/ExbB proton channel family protein, partial [Comamonadaceae bacterium]
MASCACALGLVITLVPAVAQTAAAVPAAVQAAPAEAVAASAAAPADASAKKADAVTDNPYGIESLWKTSDGVAKTVLLLLLVMSISSWYVLIVKL